VAYRTGARLWLAASLGGLLSLWIARILLPTSANGGAFLAWELVGLDAGMFLLIVVAAIPVYRAKPATFFDPGSWTKLFLIVGAITAVVLGFDVRDALHL
jgi:hypothetical protein